MGASGTDGSWFQDSGPNVWLTFSMRGLSVFPSLHDNFCSLLDFNAGLRGDGAILEVPFDLIHSVGRW